MEHLVVRFTQGLPSSIRRLGKQAGSYSIPKSKRLKTLQFMTQCPQHLLKKRKSSWEVMGIPPRMKQRGGNNYSTFLREIKKVLANVPGHELSKLPLVELQKHPRVKELYEQHFKNHPEYINHGSIANVVASSLLNYDTSTGAVRDSIADVRSKKQVPQSTIPLEIAKENEFDRLLLLVLGQFLAERRIPTLFLKSNYFTLRPQLQQAFQENPSRFRGQIEQAREHVETQIWRDYVTLVNETNRIYMSRYPFEEVALHRLTLTRTTPGFSGFRSKLQTINTLSATIPGSTAKFAGLEELTQTYARSLEAKVVNVDHFMRGVQSVMTNDRDFVVSVLKNNTRSHAKVITVLKGNSL